MSCGVLIHYFFTKFKTIALSRKLEDILHNILVKKYTVTELCASGYCMCVHPSLLLLDAICIGRLVFINDSLESTRFHT